MIGDGERALIPPPTADAAPTGLDPARVAQILTTSSAGRETRGSGYLVNTRIVLTAAHVVADAVSIRVRFNADQRGEWSARAEPARTHPGTDIALLRIDESSITPPGITPAVAAVRFGRVLRPVACEALGFPRFKLRSDPAEPGFGGAPGSFRDYRHARGTTTPWSGLREGTLEVIVAPPEYDPEPERSPWEGMSGAAVFAGDCLIGVVSKHERADGLGTLTAGRVDRWHADLAPGRIAELHDLIGLPTDPGLLVDVGSPGPGGVPRQLPATTSRFTGRRDELAHLLALAERTWCGGDPGMVVISAIDGMGGVGKTALALHAAHLLADRFPDGQLFVDLHGAHDLPARPPGDVLAEFLQGYGTPPQRIPAQTAARAKAFRDRLAGTRTLVLLDNAADEAQVRPLLPGTSGCLVLVTSRKHLTGLDDAQPLALDVLPPPEAVELFRTIAGPGRTAEGDPLLARIAELCGRLPLAVRIVAALFRNRRTWTLPHLVEKLEADESGLAVFSDGDRNLAMVFDLSYRTLDPARQTLFRRLGLVPGPDADVYAAAALLDTDLNTAGRLLDDLVDHSLLSEPVTGRYRQHDLLRIHARARAERDDPAADRDGALDRLLDYYQYTAQQADRHLDRATPVYVPAVAVPPRHTPAFDTRDEAEAWMAVELANLAAAAERSAARARPTHAAALPAAMQAYLLSHGPWAQALRLHTAAAQAARTLGDRSGQARTLNDLGRMQRVTSDHPGAAATLRRALTLYEDLGDRLGQARTLSDLGGVQQMTGDYPEAADSHRRAQALFEALGNRRGQALSLNNLGRVLGLTGDYLKAADAHHRALALSRELGDHHAQAHILNNLGRVQQITGGHLKAAETYQQALALYEELGDRHGQADALGNLGSARLRTGDYAQAADTLRRALALRKELGDRLGQAIVLADLGRAQGAIGDQLGAARDLEAALAMFREAGSRGNEAWALNPYAKVFVATGDPGRALEIYRDAVRLARTVRQPDDEAVALEGIGDCLLRTGENQDGIAHLRRALEIFRTLGMRPDIQRVEARLAELRAL
jgi:tetratricopeptide (TPR) repeat protein